MTNETVDEFVRRYLVREALEGREMGLNNETPLLEWGLLSSLEMMRLVKALESEFQVRLPETALRAENFRTIAAIRELVLRTRSGLTNASTMGDTP